MRFHFNNFIRLPTSRSPQAKRSRAVAGFGLVELMVSISIMMIVSTIILVRHTAFNGAVLLRNQAYEVAFALRQAQMLAVSGINVGASTEVQQYGVYFDADAKGENQRYIIFHDLDADGQWESGTDRLVEQNNLDPRFKIRDISNASGVSISGTGLDYNVTFVRPNFDAKFNDSVGGYETINPVYIDIAQVNRLNSDNKSIAVRRVEVTSTGNISVTSYPAP